MRNDEESSDAGHPLSTVLWVVMAGITWGVGLAFRPEEGAGRSFYLTLCMLTVAELLACRYGEWMGGGAMKRSGMPLQMGGAVMLVMYVAAVLALTALAASEVEFKWLLLGHAGALALLILGWVIVVAAMKHAKAQDK